MSDEPIIAVVKDGMQDDVDMHTILKMATQITEISGQVGFMSGKFTDFEQQLRTTSEGYMKIMTGGTPGDKRRDEAIEELARSSSAAILQLSEQIQKAIADLATTTEEKLKPMRVDIQVFKTYRDRVKIGVALLFGSILGIEALAEVIKPLVKRALGF